MTKDFYRDTYGSTLTRSDRRMLARMLETKNCWSSQTVASWLAVRHDASSIRVRISRIRRKLKGTGWTISLNEGGGQRGVYSVVPE